MRTMKSSVALFACTVLIASCISNISTVTPQAPVARVTSTSEPTNTTNPTKTSTVEPTFTPKPSDEPGLIVTLSGGGVADIGIPIFSPNGKVVTLAGGGFIRFWDANSHELMRELHPYDGRCFVTSAQFSPDSNLFAVTLQSCDYDFSNKSIGHVLVWNTSTGELLQEWEQQTATMPATSSTGGAYTIPVDAMEFLPNNQRVIFASGNTLEVNDVSQNAKHNVLKLGQKMYASQISVSPSGESAYVLMDWNKTNDVPEHWAEEYKLQVWNISTHAMIREIKYPDSWATMGLALMGRSLLEKDYKKDVSQIINLETGEARVVPFCRGPHEFYNDDNSLLACTRVIDEKQSIELWNTDNQQVIYTFVPDFEKDWLYSLNGIAFSPDNTMLAIAHNDQLSLWNIQPIVRP